MTGKFKPGIREVKGPLSGIIKAILQYQENGYNPLRIGPVLTGGITGSSEGRFSEVTLDDPATLEQEQYEIYYDHNGANRTRKPDSHAFYEDDLIALLTKCRNNLVDISWGNPYRSNEIPPRSEEGRKKLEKIVGAICR